MIKEKDKIYFLTLIAGRKQKDAILSSMMSLGAHVPNTMYGKGTANTSYLEDVMGLVHEKSKVVITCMMTKEKADVIMNMLIEKFDFHKPNTGIAFIVPVDKLSF